MAIIKRSQLLNCAGSASFSESTRRNIKTASSYNTKNIFLSHSHHDKDLAEGLKALLGSLGIELYIDWLDSDMPEITSRETAEKIKSRIKTCHAFLVLITNNALNSKWVPWEIGVADGVKQNAQILLVPVADDYGHFSGSEYLQIYKKIEIDPRLVPFVSSPSGSSEGQLVTVFRQL